MAFKLVRKLSDLDPHTPTCNWVLDLLTHRSQAVRVGNRVSFFHGSKTGGKEHSGRDPQSSTKVRGHSAGAVSAQ